MNRIHVQQLAMRSFHWQVKLLKVMSLTANISWSGYLHFQGAAIQYLALSQFLTAHTHGS